MSETTSVFERLGGREAVSAAVNLFYDKVLADPLLAPMFEGVDMARQRSMQAHFLTMAFGGENAYAGADLRTAHARLVADKGLTDVHFDAVVKHLAASLEELGVGPDLLAEVGATAESVRGEVLGR
ncbi:MAG: group 1 truncated hemoglobin [Pseudomonadota bacterium]